MKAATLNMAGAALDCVRDHDWWVFPVDREKHPITTHGFKDATQDPAQIRRWWKEFRNANIGIACGPSRIVVFDLDVKNGVNGIAAWEELFAGRDSITTATATTPSGGMHIYVNAPDVAEIGCSARALPAGIDLRGIGGYIVAPPSITATGAYAWIRPPENGIANLPPWLCALLIKPDPQPTPPPMPTERSASAYINAAVDGEVEAVRHAENGTRNHKLNAAAFSLAGLIAHGLTEDRIMSELLGAAVGAGLPELEARRTIKSGITKGRENPRQIPEGRATSTKTEAEDIDATDRLSELASARRLKKLHGKDLRHARGLRYVCWDGCCWSPNEKLAERMVHDLGKVVRREAIEIQDPQIAKKYHTHANHLESKPGISNVLSVAKALDGIDGDHIEWDHDPWLLTVPNGTIDLRTGALLPHRREDCITRICPTPFDPKAKAPRFERVLDEVFEGDRALIEYVGWSAGYMLTGLVCHDSFYIYWGDGSNGKTTVVSTFQRVLGPDIAMQIDPEDLLQQKHGRHSTGIAQLRGARLVIAQESGESRRLNEPLVKALSGGDKIRARLICQDGYEFFPTLKLVICTNALPTIRDTSYGLWRRVRLIPFTRTFQPKEQDRHLRDTLVAEAPGILAWAVRNAARAAEEPPLPAKVKAATATYQAQEDTLGGFLSECCQTGPHDSVSNTALYVAYQQWTGGRCESHRAFSMHLKARALETYQVKGLRFWRGISLVNKDLGDE